MLRQRTHKQQVAQSASLPAPIGGLNARDSVAMMPETDAITLDNWFPSNTSVDLRKGYDDHATFTGDCETILIYNGAAATGIFVAVDDSTNQSIIDATTGGAISTAVVGGASDTVHALTSARFDYTNFSNSAGQFLLALNGADDGVQYNGTTWSTWTLTGVDTDDLFSIAVYAERLWMPESGTFSVWYLDVNAITGTATELDLGSLFDLGGSLSNVVTWADFIGFVSTEGEVVVFNGSDPSSVGTWARVGHFRVGKPVRKGNRAWTPVGSDALLITVDGLISMSLVMTMGAGAKAASDKIRNVFNSDVVLHGAKFGWQVVLHSAGHKLIVNVPTVATTSSYQYVMNTQTGAWCRFTGWNAFCFAATNSKLYWGGDGVLNEADTGRDDNDDSINADAKQAFSYLGQRGRVKQMTMARPILNIDGPVSLRLGVDVDYQDRDPGSVIPVAGNAGDPWETTWDTTWTGAAVVYRSWNSIRGVGTAIAPRLKIQADGISLSWSATDLVFQAGGIL